MGLDINELSLMAAMLAGSFLSNDGDGWKLFDGQTTHSGDRLTRVAHNLLKQDYIRNVKTGHYSVTANGRYNLTRFNVRSRIDGGKIDG